MRCIASHRFTSFQRYLSKIEKKERNDEQLKFCLFLFRHNKKENHKILYLHTIQLVFYDDDDDI